MAKVIQKQPPVTDSCERPPMDEQIAGVPDGTYSNATIVVRNGRIISIDTGKPVIYSAADPCCEQAASTVIDEGNPALTPSNPGAAGPFFESSDCVAVQGDGSLLNPFSFDLADACKGTTPSGASFDACGFKIENGIVKTFTAPITGLVPLDNSIEFVAVEGQSCVVGVRVKPTAVAGGANRQRVVCCACSSGGGNGVAAGVAIVEIIGTQAPYQLTMCGYTGTLGPPALAFNAGPYDTYEAAVAAMNAATCSGPCESQGGNGA